MQLKKLLIRQKWGESKPSSLEENTRHAHSRTQRGGENVREKSSSDEKSLSPDKTCFYCENEWKVSAVFILHTRMSSCDMSISSHSECKIWRAIYSQPPFFCSVWRPGKHHVIESRTILPFDLSDPLSQPECKLPWHVTTRHQGSVRVGTWVHISVQIRLFSRENEFNVSSPCTRHPGSSVT